MVDEFDAQKKFNEEEADKIHEMISWYENKNFKFPKILSYLEKDIISNIGFFIDPDGNEKDFKEVMNDFIDEAIEGTK